ncbi:hypothetical protein [Photorhabdus aegyptia]|nr:hypothetical protein [Photorhabdus aegyptia]
MQRWRNSCSCVLPYRQLRKQAFIAAMAGEIDALQTTAQQLSQVAR